MRARRAAEAAGAAGAALLLALTAACGSRLPESAFEDRRGTPATGPAREPITVGIITSTTSPVGGEAFTGPRDGALAYFAALNRNGGVNGRPVRPVTCDDGGSGVGNNECVRKLLTDEKVFALVATTALDYAGAPRVSAAGVPDIGGQPVGAAYDTYPHLYGIYGSQAPRDGKAPGWGGTLYGGTEVYRYFKRVQKARSAAVVSYNQAASAAYARLIVRGLEAEGYDVTTEQVDFALPNFPAVAAGLRDRGADLVFDALDTHGNARLCEAMDAAGVRPTAKVTNVQNWSDVVAKDYKDSPGCRNALWATGASRNYDDQGSGPGSAAVREFRAGMARHAQGRPLSQWQLEGWAAAMWFADAARSCGAEVTRACVEHFVADGPPYTARGLLLPASFRPRPEPPATDRTCLSVARWRDGARGGKGGWVTQGDMDTTCFTVPQLPYRP
ncbi:ABC transporter substrate-binding protein [Streptomyces rimosus]|uniref:ABC transporter substrate-binding protein n=1 Tax=Streptomyces rimosus TaxID=1927 RepID=UPI0004C071AA|nr:ABC transporter substrate-binding protein [Streptomyces rimosus]